MRPGRALPCLGLACILGCAGLPEPPPREPLAAELADDTVRELQPEKPGSGEVRFDSEPQGAELLIDNRLRGVTPLLIGSLPQGRYKIEARKAGYRPFSDWVDHSGRGARYSLVLQPLAGRLAVTVSPPGAEVTVGGRKIGAGIHQLPAGEYRVRAKAFGYVDAEGIVQVEADATTSVDLVLQAAPFSARLTGVSHRRFDPDLGGERGRVVIAWEATAPAALTLRVLASTGVEVYRESAAPAGPRAEIEWRGRTCAGDPVEDGSYRALLELRASEGELVTLETALIVSRRPLPPPAAQWSGAAGLLYAPSPQVAEPGAGAFTFSSALLMAPAQEAPVESAPVLAAVRAGLMPALELDAAVGALLVEEPPVPVVMAAAFKRALLQPPARPQAAVLARASLQAGSGSDPFMAFTGMGAALPVALTRGRAALIVCPEIVASPWRATGDDTYDDDPGFNVWAYLRAGASARLRRLSVGISTAARTAPFAEGLSFEAPVALGAEAHWSPPDSRLLLSLWAGLELGGWAVERVLAGAAFGYLY